MFDALDVCAQEEDVLAVPAAHSVHIVCGLLTVAVRTEREERRVAFRITLRHTHQCTRELQSCHSVLKLRLRLGARDGLCSCICEKQRKSAFNRMFSNLSALVVLLKGKVVLLSIEVESALKFLLY